MAELRDRLAQRKRDKETQQDWFRSLFNRSPWIATLISTLTGPIIMILLVLLFGPCIINKIAQFVKARLSKINVMVLEQ
ncbi:ENV1 protein, partial [Erythrocercus mccallii]|nr:ENV1 protein [Erythrocercus mccallii]